jgi:hypothetical protein
MFRLFSAAFGAQKHYEFDAWAVNSWAYNGFFRLSIKGRVMAGEKVRVAVGPAGARGRGRLDELPWTIRPQV